MSEFIETTVDKFLFRVATDRQYSNDGLWVSWLEPHSSNRVRVGLTDYLQQHSGDMAFVTVRPMGSKLQVGAPLADVETIKINLTLPAPVSGTIVAVNAALDVNPEFVNQSPYDKGWLAEIEAADWEAGRAALLDAKSYFAVMKAQAEEEAKRS